MARRGIPPTPVIQARQFTIAEIDPAIRKLRRRIDDVRALDPSTVRFGDAKVHNVENSIRETIREVFGDQSPELSDNARHRIWHGGYNALDSDGTRQSKFAAGIPQTATLLEGLIARLEEKKADLAEIGQPRRAQGPAGNRRVFVVHGHDDAAKEATARFLAQLDLEPIILHEQANEGRTVIEKFEGHADVDFAVVLLTPDDRGFPASTDPITNQPRARQNVVFELGYFVGRLTRRHVCALYKGNVELPSDINGVIYVPMDPGGAWRGLLAREIRAAGIDVDLNQAI